MNTLKTMARKAGALYFLIMIVGLVDQFAFPRFMVPGDATVTARNILASELTYRIGILIDFVSFVIFIILAVSLYRLFKDVDRWHAMLMVLFVSMGIALSLANLAAETAPLILLSGADYLSVFSKPQLDALTLGFLRLEGSGSIVATAFWGLWLFPFGILVIKSGFIPKLLGIALIVAGFAYVISSFTSIVLPDYRVVVSQVMMPLYFGEVPIIFWLLIMGVKAPLSPRGVQRDV